MTGLVGQNYLCGGLGGSLAGTTDQCEYTGKITMTNCGSSGGFAGTAVSATLSNLYLDVTDATSSITSTIATSFCGYFFGQYAVSTLQAAWGLYQGSINCHTEGPLSGTGTPVPPSPFINLQAYISDASSGPGGFTSDYTPDATLHSNAFFQGLNQWDLVNIWMCPTPTVYPLLRNVDDPPNLCPQATGDPHLVGLKGQKFFFAGEAGKIYNLISTPDFSVNAHLGSSNGPHNFTVITAMGIRVGNDSIFVNAYARLKVNGERVPLDQAEYVLSDGVSVLTRDVKKAGKGQTLTTPKFFIQMKPRGYEIDLSSLLMKGEGDSSIHGVLGQTWNTANWPAETFQKELKDQTKLWEILEGNGEDDYIVKDGLYGTDFKFNQFDIQRYNAPVPFIHFPKVLAVSQFQGQGAAEEN